jgi:hypothetical protein
MNHSLIFGDRKLVFLLYNDGNEFTNQVQFQGEGSQASRIYWAILRSPVLIILEPNIMESHAYTHNSHSPLRKQKKPLALPLPEQPALGETAAAHPHP